jgi:predicted nucleotide-binding protein (sugar kinase/HSP70/actin superfamily)
MRKITFPRMGAYTAAFEYMVKEMGHEPVTPPPTSQKTIKLGVRHSSDMVCFPFKATLGNLIEGLEMGADTILVTGLNPSTKKPQYCRFLYYYHIQELILKRLGYKFDTLWIRPPGQFIIREINRVSDGNLNTYKTMKLIRRMYERIKDIEDKEYKFVKNEINIGLVGEVYTLWEESVNYDIVRKLKSMGVGVHMSTTLTWFLKHQVHLADTKKHLKKEVNKYFPKRIGGHGYESLYNTIDYAKNGFDGVIHLLPLSCMPETLIEMPMNMISEDYRIPVYRFPIDENRFEAGFDTRLETFVKVLQRGKKNDG